MNTEILRGAVDGQRPGEGVAPDVSCSACGGMIDAPDRFCRHCGRPRGRPVAAWYHRPLWILVLAFTVLGPFALPLVWRSPVMDRPTKWILCALILIATVLAAYGCWRAGQALFRSWQAILSELEGMGAL